MQLCCLAFLAPVLVLLLAAPFLPLLVHHGAPLALSLLLRRPVRLGAVELGWRRLVLHEVEIDNAPGFSYPRFAGAEQVSLEPDWGALLRGRLRLHSVELKAPELRLEIDQERRKNIPRSGRPKKPGGRGAQATVEAIFEKVEVGKLRVQGGIYTMRLRRQDLELEAPGIEIELRRAREGAAYEVSRLDVPSVHLRVGQRLDVRGGIHLRNALADAKGVRAESLAVLLEDGTRVEASGPALENYTDPVLTIDPHAVVDLRDVTRALHLPLTLEGVARLEGELRGPARDLRVQASLRAPQLEASKQGQRLRGEATELHGQLELHGTVITARDVHFGSLGGDVHLDAEIELAREKRSVRATVVQSGGELLQALQELGVPVELSGRWSAFAEIEGTGFSKDALRGSAVILLDGGADGGLEPLRQPAASTPSAAIAPVAPAVAAGAPAPAEEEGVDLQSMLDLASELAASEALLRTELGQEENFLPRGIRDRVLQDLRGRPLAVRGKLQVSLGGGEVFLESAKLELAGSKVEGFGKIGLDRTLDLAFQAASEEIGVLCYALRPYLLSRGIDVFPWTVGQGRGVFHGRLKGSTKAPVLDGVLAVEEGLYQRFAFDRLDGRFHFEHNRIQIEAALADGKSRLRASGWIASGPRAKGHLQTLRSPFVSLEWLSSLPDMDVLLETDDYSLPRLADQMGARLPGSLHLRGKAHLFKDQEKLYAEMSLQALADGYLAGQKVEGLDVAASIADGQLKLTRFHGSVNGSPVILAGTAEPPARLELDLDVGPIELAPIIKLLKLPVPLSGRIRVVMSVEGLLPTPVLRFSLSTEGLAIGGYGAPPGEAELDLAVRGRELLVQGQFLGGSIGLSGKVGLLAPFETLLDLELTEAQLAPLLGLVSASLAEYISGSLGGKFRLEGPLARARQLRLDGALQTASLQLTEVKVANEEPVRIVLEDGRFELLPTRFSGTGGSFLTSASYQVRGPFELDTEGVANLVILEDFDRSEVIEAVTGKADVKVHVRSAPLELPSITGTAAVSAGYFKLTTLVQAIYPIQGTIHLDYPDLTVSADQPMTAVFGDGPVQLWGTVVANSARFEDILLDLTMKGTKLNYFYLPEMETVVSPDLKISGTAAVPLVSGRLVMDALRYKGRIELKAMLVRTAEQTTGALLSQRTQLTPEEVAPTTIDPVLDLQVSLPNAIHIDSKGVDVRISSPQLRVVGTYLHTGLLGTLNIEEGGKVAYEDREFTVKAGTVEFLDPTRLNPSVNLEMEGEVGEHDISVNVTGTAENPTTHFQSNPPLPELDILTIILGGAPDTYVIDPATGAQEQRSRSAEQLVGAAATALELDDAVFQRVGNILAADRFLVDPVITESGFQGARITWGKSVGKLDIVATQVLPATEPPLVLFKYKLSDHVFIEGRNKGGNLDETDVDLKFRWDFR